MEQQRTLLDYLKNGDEAERIAVVRDFVFKIETYWRTMALMFSGLAAKAEGDAARDLWAAQVSAEEVGQWLDWHWQQLAIEQPIEMLQHPSTETTAEEQTFH